MTEIETLLPCPFCGGEAERIDIEDGNNAGGSFICCTVCQASGNVEFEFKENFVSNWNRRAVRPLSATAAPDATELLEECLEYFESRADTDCDQDGFLPNEEMSMASRIKESLGIA